MIQILIHDIEWDDEGQGLDECRLPSNVLLLADTPIEEDDVSEYLSEAFGFCHYGYNFTQFDQYRREQATHAGGGFYPDDLAIIKIDTRGSLIP